MMIVVSSSRSKSNRLARVPRFHIYHLIQSFQLLKVILSLQMWKTSMEKLLPKIINTNGRAKTHTKFIWPQKKSSSLLPLLLFSFIQYKWRERKTMDYNDSWFSVLKAVVTTNLSDLTDHRGPRTTIWQPLFWRVPA